MLGGNIQVIADIGQNIGDQLQGMDLEDIEAGRGCTIGIVSTWSLYGLCMLCLALNLAGRESQLRAHGQSGSFVFRSSSKQDARHIQELQKKDKGN